MRILGTGEAVLADLQLPRQLIAERKGTVNVNDLGADLQKWGAYLHNPTVRKADMRVIAGRDRIIGAIKIGWKTLSVTFVDCSDEEAEELEMLENLHRRCDPDEQAAQRRAYLDLLERRQAEEPDHAEEPRPGRTKSPRAKAREELAPKVGVTPEALRKQEQRREPPAWGEAEEAAPSIKDFGLAVPPTVDARARRVQALVDEADTHLRALARLVNGLKESGASEADATKAQDEYSRFAYFMRGLRPQALCPWCKGVVGVDKCPGCYATGFASVDKMRRDIPAPLLLEGDKAMVQSEDKRGFRALSGPALLKAPPHVVNGKQLTIVVDDGKGGEMKIDPATGEVLPF